MPGYHLAEIARGAFGHPSKIVEETAEFADAVEQGVKVMELVELSDLVGAIRGYLARKYPGITLDDLIAMADVTERAFLDGTRQPR